MKDSLLYFRLHTNLSFGPGSLNEIIPFLEEKGFNRVGVIIDLHVEKGEYWQQLIKKLRKLYTINPYFINDMMEPTYDYLDSIRGKFDKKIDCLLGIGGGSTMDVAKAISVLVTNKKRAIAYRGFGLIKNSGIPLILIPSTAGSGSEITPYAVFIDRKEKRKFGINSPLYLPVFSVIDPLLTLSCPSSVTIASGMDALTHTLESFVAKKHSLLSKLFSEEAFPLIFNNLERVVKNPEDINLRTQVSLGAYLAGIALFNSAAGPAGVLSYPIGTLFRVTHGLAGSVFLYPVIKFNIENGYKGYETLYDLVDPSVQKKCIGKDKSQKFLHCFQLLCANLDIPEKLNTFGVQKSDIDSIIDHLKFLWSAVEQNPIPMTEKNIRAMLHSMID
ncbi:iron-containing alcohol dehydrogenase [Candidatus Gottesmanbacteria bacterium]|nr:iron-containing alcohol dehydrogenase [Candidatus Gottesmanbacteria bacterium]